MQVRFGGGAREIGEKAGDGNFHRQVAIFLTKANQRNGHDKKNGDFLRPGAGWW